MGSDDETSGIVDDDDDDIHPLDRDSRVDEVVNQPVVTKAGPESISININDQVQRVYTDYAENFVEFDSERGATRMEKANNGEQPQRISKSGGLR